MATTEMMAATGIQYVVLTELVDVKAIAPEWNALLSKSSCNRAFSSAQWFLASCRLKMYSRMNVIVARRNGAIVGILPLVLERSGEELVGSFPDTDGDYNDMITAADDVSAMTGLLSHALSPSGNYHQLILSRLRSDSNCALATRIVQPNGDPNTIQAGKTICPYIRLLSSYDDYLLTRSTSFRTSLWQAQALAARHNIRVRELQPQTFSSDSLSEVFLSLHLTRFAELSPLNSSIAQAFVHEVFPDLFAERGLRAFALYEAKRIVALNICMVGSASLCFWNGGFTAAAKRWSPGKLLINAGIRAAFDSGLAEYDFLRGLEPYKSSWATAAREIGEIEFNLRRKPTRQ